MKDSGVSMTLDNDLSDEAYDAEAYKLRDALREIHSKPPNRRTDEDGTSFTLAKNSENHMEIVKHDTVKTDKEAEKNIQSSAIAEMQNNEIQDNKVNIHMAGVSDAAVRNNKIDSAHKTNAKTSAEFNRCLHIGIYPQPGLVFDEKDENNSLPPQMFRTSNRNSNLGLLHHQERNGSRTLEIYNNATVDDNNSSKSPVSK